MCGLAGFAGSGFSADGFKRILNRMGDAIAHRGPDDSGIWIDASAGVGLVHRRLSIVDLSPAGHQPMISASQRFVLVYNGEIYNHSELRSRVQEAGRQGEWRGHSDTETLLAGFDAWGIEETLRRSVGMFAIAVWDRLARTLILARDRLGEKPLYYGYIGKGLAFGSELKALVQVRGVNPAIDRTALGLLMRYGYVPAPNTIYHGVAKLAPASLLEIPVEAITRGIWPAPRTYWSAQDAAAQGVAHPLAFGSETEAVDSLEAVLEQAIAGQMVADVPVGAFLSGGVDSSAVVALMQKLSSRPVKTFTIGFSEEAYNEAAFAKRVAQHLGTEHTELYLSPQAALDVIPKLPEIYCEPFADPSQIPTYLVAKLARQHVTVSLSGDAGDELFGGYTRYFLAARLWEKIERVPLALRHAVAQALLSVRPSAWDAIYRALMPLIPERKRWPAAGNRLHKGASLLNAPDISVIYSRLISHWAPEDIVLEGGGEDNTPLANNGLVTSAMEKMMLCDSLTYLPDDILVKVDRAAMANSLETRAPFLDHRVYEYAWRLPLRYKVRGGTGKWLLREVLYRHVPRDLIERPKMGFGVPIDSWLRGPLRAWAEELLSETRLRNEGYFKPAAIRQKWLEHLSGKRDWQYALWNVLMFQAWNEAAKAKAASKHGADEGVVPLLHAGHSA
jgi:asparagine synthase (glutamine-hydrolysing)